MSQSMSSPPPENTGASIVADVSGGDGPFAAFCQVLFARMPEAELEAMGADRLRAIAEQSWDWFQRPFDGTARVEVTDLTDVLGAGNALVRIINTDMPFLVDSVLGELQAAGCDAGFLAHPVFETRRDGDGRLSTFQQAAANGGGEGHRESLIAVVAEGLEPVRFGDVERELQAVLATVAIAVRDWRRMLDWLAATLEQFIKSPAQTPPDLKREAIEFGRWLIDGHFVFLGMREYRFKGGAETGELEEIEGSGMGVLADPTVQVLRRGTEMVALTPEIRRFYLAPQPVFVTKSNVMSRVHRRVHMDYVGFKVFDADGRLTGELRIVGLFTSRAYTTTPNQIPLLRQKAARVVELTGYIPGSHDAKALSNVIDTFPRDELFQIGVERLAEWAPQIVDLEARPRTRIFVRPDRFDRFVSVLAYLSRERFSTAARERIGAILTEAYGGQIVMFQPYFTEGQLVRVHFIVGRFEGATPTVDVAALEARIADAVRTWPDRLANAIRAAGPDQAVRADRYCSAFPAGYTETYDVGRALADAAEIESMGADDPVRVRFHLEQAGAGEPHLHATVYSKVGALPLSQRVPVFESMGFHVIDERSFAIRPAVGDGDRPRVALHDMHLERPRDADLDLARDGVRLREAFLAVHSGRAENDPFNGLVLFAGADWRRVAMLRALAHYLRQAGSPLGANYMAETFLRYPDLARRLIALFEVRFDPDNGLGPEERADEAAAIRVEIEEALTHVPSLDEDRIVRANLGLIMATLRTNFYTQTPDGTPPLTIAMKLDAKAIDILPEPRPHREIWVYSPEVEGVHLRFAPIARGGIRWSDRAQDFRTEVLGLAKAQQVKNTVIVPEGAKGGFVAKRLPPGGDREAIYNAGVAVYQTFVRSMLSITDNLDQSAVVPPERVIRYDGDDPYLVVAADKGTATFSDFANEISQQTGHWLDDAFASGGSAGYDHKKMGITARGAWACVQRHFREIDHDIQTEPFTAAGVGDMSGDVFGNGMLLSPVTRLIAAFDHRDIFIDPDPDPAAGFAERKRLFDMGRSSWKDYDTAKISAGGGVFSRQSKSIELSDEIRAVLGITDHALPPNALIRAILKMPIDLMWFGGIGTYIRAAGENDSDVGDRGNDAVRVTAGEVRARVIGEGANLGVTQRGRIAFAAAGGRINTDFIDNSAGVNSSDLEVNIKIALGAEMASGRLDRPTRNALLERMTDDVAEACLRNNRQQSLAISLATRDSAGLLGYDARLMRYLEHRGMLDRALEMLPSERELKERRTAGLGLTRPEISVLLSYAKLALAADLTGSTLADDPAFEPLLFEYFPDAMQHAHRDAIAAHRLRKEIIVTRITNSVINRCGPSAVVRLADETGRRPAEIAKAVMATRAIFDLPGIWEMIDGLGFDVSGDTQLSLYAATQATLIQQAAALLRTGGDDTLDTMIAMFRPAVEELRAALPGVATERQRADVAARVDRYRSANVPVSLAEALANLDLLRFAPAIRRLQMETGAEHRLAAEVMLAMADRFGLLRIETLAQNGNAADYYDRLAINGAITMIERAARQAASHEITGGRERQSGIQRAAQMLAELADVNELSVSRLTVTAGQVRDLVEA